MEPDVVISRECFKILDAATPKKSISHRALSEATLFYGTIRCRCTKDEADELLEIAKSFCPEAVADIEEAIEFSRPTPRSATVYHFP
jgi:hypothetical protein